MQAEHPSRFVQDEGVSWAVGRGTQRTSPGTSGGPGQAVAKSGFAGEEGQVTKSSPLHAFQSLSDAEPRL